MVVVGGLYKNENNGSKVWVVKMGVDKVFYRTSGSHCVDNMNYDLFQDTHKFIKIVNGTEIELSIGDIWKSKYTENYVKIIDTYEEKVAYEWVGSGGKQNTIDKHHFVRDFKWVKASTEDSDGGKKGDSAFRIKDTIKLGDEAILSKSNMVSGVKHSHYFKDVRGYDYVDVYAVCKIFGVDDLTGCTHHAIKKLLVTGKRGHKDRLTDLQNVIDTVQRLIELEKAEEANAKGSASEFHYNAYGKWVKEEH